MVVPLKNGTVKHARKIHVAEYFKDICDMERHFFCDQDSAARAIRHIVPRENIGIHPSSIRRHCMFCHLVTRACGTAAARSRA